MYITQEKPNWRMLFEALHAFAGFLRAPESAGKSIPGQNGDDGNHHEQLDKRKPRFGARGLRWIACFGALASPHQTELFQLFRLQS